MYISVICHLLYSILLIIVGALLYYVLNYLLDIPGRGRAKGLLKPGTGLCRFNSRRVNPGGVFITVLILAVIICNILIKLAGG